MLATALIAKAKFRFGFGYLVWPTFDTTGGMVLSLAAQF